MNFLRGQPWSTDLFQQFESICQKVEDLIDDGKDKVKHEKHHLQDEQPSSEDSGKPKIELFSDGQVDLQRNVVSATKQDTVKLDEDHVQSVGRRLCSSVFRDECTLPGSTEVSVGDEQVDVHSQVVSAISIEAGNVCPDQNVSAKYKETTKTSIPNQLDPLMNFSETLDEALMITNSCLSSKMSIKACEEDMFSVTEHLSTFSDDNDWISFDSGSGCELQMLKHPIFDEAGSLSLPQKTSADSVNEDVIGSSLDQALEVTICDEISTEAKSSRGKDFIKATNVSGDNVSMISSCAEACETKPVDASFGFLISGSNVCSFGSRGNELLAQASQTSTFAPRTEKKFGFDSAINYSRMESIELSPATLKPDATMVQSLGHSSRHRKKGFSYYKKLIEDRLTSRSRLSKEYQLLHIYHGEELSNNGAREVVPLELTEADWELV